MQPTSLPRPQASHQATPSPSRARAVLQEPTSPDALLWESAADGDPQALEDLFQRVRVEARAWLGRRGLPEGDREDLVSEVQVAVLRLLRSGEPAPRNLGGFLYFRARAVTSRYLRRKQVRDPRSEPAVLTDLQGNEPDPHDQTQRARLLAATRACREALPEPLGEVLRLRYEEGLSQASVGRRLDRSDVWVHRRVRQALSLLSHCLTSKGWTP